MSQLLVIFATVFLAELGDKTQLATLFYAADSQASRWLIFLAAAGALVLSTAIAVVAGTLAQEYLKAIPLKLVAGMGFIVVGAWTVWSHYHP